MTEAIPTEPALDQKRGFRWREVPPVRDLGPAEVAAAPAPDLGPLASFSGKFWGTGFNTIFRPQNFAVSPVPLPTPGTGINDNVLELNLTEEILSFSAPIGSIPNRGTVQGDVFLNGVPYLQTISDVSDPRNPADIHLEPGVWLIVPPTTAPAETQPTLVRMASIPHGTTINAQGTSFPAPGGRPRIDPVDITPFPVGDPANLIRFDSQNVDKTDTFRIPQDLKNFVTAGTITQEILDDPNLVLRKRADAQDFTATTVIVIDTSPGDPLFGGGTDNIAFLEGDKTATNPNADAVRMTAIFWIETVVEKITVPVCGPGEQVIVTGRECEGVPPVRFAITATKELTEATEIDATYTQIQYTQTVFLNFAGLTWPHVSVATLVPYDRVQVAL